MSRSLPREAVDTFFAPLVGSEENVAGLERHLAGYVRGELGDQAATDPYARLEAGLLNVVTTTASRHLPPTLLSRIDRERLASNGHEGARLTVAAIRAVGNAYRKNAKVPQEVGNVSRNTDRVLQHIFRIAFADQTTGTINTESLGRGVNPRNPFFYRLAFISGAIAPLPRLRVHLRTLKTTADPSGQLVIRPRWQLRKPALPRQCPATHARVEMYGRRQSALLTFMRAAGRVAAAEIFPHQFPITPGNTAKR